MVKVIDEINPSKVDLSKDSVEVLNYQLRWIDGQVEAKEKKIEALKVQRVSIEAELEKRKGK